MMNYVALNVIFPSHGVHEADIRRQFYHHDKEMPFTMIYKIHTLYRRYIMGSAPMLTGNLRFNAIDFYEDKNSVKITVNTEVAPYMKYTNEDWLNFRPPLYGKKNPNQNWWNRAAQEFAFALATELDGHLCFGDLQTRNDRYVSEEAVEYNPNGWSTVA